tara:strand:+ start:273 stop:647 length:375 start_codon:yes stop_codon:yes gene_type:complete
VNVFKNKWFKKWAQKENISDKTLFKAAEELVQGSVEAELGGYLFKKRVPKPGSGKRGGYRVIVAYKNGHRIVFLFAFAKNKKSNITDKEKSALMIIAKSFMEATKKQLEALIKEGSIWEVKKND